MRIFRSQIPIELEDSYKQKTVLKEDVNYIVPDNVVEMIKQSEFAERVCRDDDFYEIYGKMEYTGQDLTGKSLITFRNGGIGDLMFQLPSLKKLYDTTGVKITVVCNKNYMCIFEGLEYVNKIMSLPFTTDDIEQYDYYINFEGLIELNPDAEILDAYTLHAKKFGVEPDSLTPVLSVDKDAEEKVLRDLDNYKSKKRIAIAWSSSVAIRAIDPTVYANVIATTPPDYRFFICGSKKDVPEIKTFIAQLPGLKNKITNWAEKYDELKYSMALIKNCDCVIGPDSGLLHVAGGYGIPIVGLFGAFPSRLRLKHYKNTIGINAKSTCTYGRGETNNCFQHGTGSCNLAQKRMEYFSPCMSKAINHNHVIYALTKLRIL